MKTETAAPTEMAMTVIMSEVLTGTVTGTVGVVAVTRERKPAALYIASACYNKNGIMHHEASLSQNL